jgi:Family of unknown function (DUF6527)
VTIALLQPRLVDFIPKELDDGVLYISNRFQTASHRCACGCGTKIVTPFRNAEYKITMNGDRVSLSPSIGNWNHPCQSHYWIKDNAVIWAGAMTKAQILAGRAEDDAFREAYFEDVAWPWYRKFGGWITAQGQAILKALGLT